MNMFKKNGGFTLVELIVVIAILAILAGIAVPAYSGYLSSAQKAGDITALSAVKTAAFAAMATEGEVVDIEVVAKEGVITSVKVNMAYETDKTKDSNNAEVDNTATSHTVLYQAAIAADATAGTDAVEADENADFMAFMNNALPELKYFTDGAIYDTAPAKAFAENEDALKDWNEVFGNGWAAKADVDELNKTYANIYPNA